MSEPMADDEVGFGLPDPPYVAGDHYTTCRGCDHCAELEDRYFAEKDRLQLVAEMRRLQEGIRTKAEAWDREEPDALAFRVTADFRTLIGDDDE